MSENFGGFNNGCQKDFHTLRDCLVAFTLTNSRTANFTSPIFHSLGIYH